MSFLNLSLYIKSFPVLYGGSIYIHLILFKYDSCNIFNTSKLSPSMYIFCVLSKSTDFSFTGLNVFLLGVFAATIASFFPGHVN